MDVYQNNTSVTLTIPLIDENDKALTPASVSYEIFDEVQAELQATTAVANFTSGDTSVSVTISSAINTIAAKKGLRVVRVTTISTDGSTGIVIVRYVLQNGAALAKGVNSYQEFGEALLVTMDMPDLMGWMFSTDRKRQAAMAEAYNRIGMLRFDIEGREIIGLNTLEAADFNQLSPVFLEALSKAQVSEADIILGGDPIHSKREEGLLSDSVGESAIMFRPGKPLLLSVSRRTLNYLSGFVSFNNALGRR